MTRERKIRRLVAVQLRLHELAQWELMDCSAREHEAEERQRRIIEGFNAACGMPALAAQTASRNLRSASIARETLARTRETLAAQALAEARKLKQVQRVSDAADRSAARTDEKRALEDIIDAAARRAQDRERQAMTSLPHAVRGRP
ncbi:MULTISPECIES: hypothetical protein [unclassified Bradyrhizobium]|uniref:hypothetical protein n=1 Tax=unclassified Bradyrhizobium TaxID=2631580 RepID=UPI0020116917|nr:MULTISPECIES: hypothetical protein [unclassified Bradyrhizobium]